MGVGGEMMVLFSEQRVGRMGVNTSKQRELKITKREMKVSNLHN